MEYITKVSRYTEHAQTSPATPDPDLVLVRAMAQGDTDALDELYQRCGQRLLSYLQGRLGELGLAEEVLQDVMLAAWKGAGQFRGEGRVLAWLLTIAHNRAINAYQRNLRRMQAVESEFPLDAEVVSAGQSAGSDPEALREALQALPEAQRETLELVFFQGLSLDESAQVLGVATGTVKSRLHRAKARLRALLQAQEGTYE